MEVLIVTIILVKIRTNCIAFCLFYQAWQSMNSANIQRFWYIMAPVEASADWKEQEKNISLKD